MIAFKKFEDDFWKFTKYEKAAQFADSLESGKLIGFSQSTQIVTVWYHNDATSQGTK